MKLDIGAGNALEIGWQSWDIKDGKDARNLEGIDDGSIEEIRAIHVLEHIEMPATFLTLQEWFRALKPGGRVYIAVPDFVKIACAMLDGVRDPDLERYLMGGQTDEHDFHHAVFSRVKLGTLLWTAGFERIRVMPAEGRNCSHHWCSLNIEAFKP